MLNFFLLTVKHYSETNAYTPCCCLLCRLTILTFSPLHDVWSEGELSGWWWRTRGDTRRMSLQFSRRIISEWHVKCSLLVVFVCRLSLLCNWAHSLLIKRHVTFMSGVFSASELSLCVLTSSDESCYFDTTTTSLFFGCCSGWVVKM